MVITRKIEVFVCEDDKELRKEYYQKLYDNRNIAVKAANATVSNMFILDNSLPYLSEDDRKKIGFIGAKGDKVTRKGGIYAALSAYFKGKADMGMISCVKQNAEKMYADDMKHGGFWEKSLRSYKSNMPVPFDHKRFTNLRFADYTDGAGKTRNGCFFTLLGVPFQCKFGSDRSGNRLIMERVINGEYKMCTSSLKFVKNKIFLLLCVDIPKKDVKVDEKKALYAFLGVMQPIVCTTQVDAYKDFDSGMKVWDIGIKEEFNYRRRQIQEAVKRCQINNRYTKGGKGRKRKCKAIDRWHEIENNYVDTKLHTYSKRLVDMAVKHGCGKIVLMKQIHREDNAKAERDNGDDFVLRNWTYFGLKQKIDYKAKMYGIKVEVEK